MRAIVIELKNADLSIEKALPQFLTYMLKDIQPETSSFGMIAKGGNFIFVKLVRVENPQYALSDEFVLRKCNNELYSVLQILKCLSQLTD